jgi:hypothetical protein
MGAAIFQSCDFISKTRQRIFIGSEVVARFWLVENLSG